MAPSVGAPRKGVGVPCAIRQLQVAALTPQDAGWLGIIGLPMVKTRARCIRRVIRHAVLELPAIARALIFETRATFGLFATGPRRALPRRRVSPCSSALPLPSVQVPTPSVLAVGFVGGVPLPSRLLLGFPAAATAPAPRPTALP